MKFKIDMRAADPMIFRMLRNHDFSASQRILYIGVGDGSNILEIERRIKNKKMGGGSIKRNCIIR